MCFTKRVRLVVLLVVAAALLAGTPALAAPKKAGGTAPLKPPGTSDEPNASGRAKFDGLWVQDPGLGWYAVGDLTVTCGGLTPGATYRTTAGSFSASTTGEGTLTIGCVIFGSLFISVAREEAQPDGSVERVVVLEGTLKVR